MPNTYKTQYEFTKNITNTLPISIKIPAIGSLEGGLASTIISTVKDSF